MTDETKDLTAIDVRPDFFGIDDLDVEAYYNDGVIFISMPSIIICGLEEAEQHATKRRLLVDDVAIRREMDDIIKSLMVPIHADETPKKKATYPNNGHFNPRGRRGRIK